MARSPVVFRGRADSRRSTARLPRAVYRDVDPTCLLTIRFCWSRSASSHKLSPYDLSEKVSSALNLFVNDREGRPRAFWRLLFQFSLSFVGQAILTTLALVAFALGGGMAIGGAEDFAAIADSPLFVAAGGAISLVVMVLSVWLAGRLLDKRPFRDFGLRLDRAWWLDLGFGLLLGAVLMTAVFLVEFSAGWVTITGTFASVSGGSFLAAIAVPAVFFLCVGFYEELVSRGYQLTNLAEGLNFPAVGPRGAVLLAWVISSSIFGLLHLLNPNSSIVSTLNISFAGILLGTGYVLTGKLAIPVGLHVTWNFFQGNVFGFPVSGIETIGATFVETKQGGPDIVTGGVFGPEAGLLGLGTMVVGVCLTFLYVRLRYGKVALQTSLAEPPIRGQAAPGAS